MRQLRTSGCGFRICPRAALHAALALGLFTGLPVAEAEQAPKLPVVGVLITDTAGNISLPILVQGLRDLGYVDGKNIVIEVRSAGGKPDALPALAAELVQHRVDALYATGPAAIRAARSATAEVPIVALDLESDPVQAGWVRTLARPGGNLTGLFLDLPSLTGKWLELLKETVPGTRRVGLLWDSTTGSAQLTAAKAAAQGLGLDLRVMETRSTDDLDAVLRTGVSAGSRAFVLLSSPIISTRSEQIAAFVVRNRLPAVSPFRKFADAGGLMSYGPDFDAFRERAASYVDRILRGAKPGDLPIQQPTKFEMVINLKAAKALGLKVPRTVLERADEVIR